MVPDSNEPSTSDGIGGDSRVLVVAAVAALLVLLYSLLVVQEFLLGVLVVVLVAGLGLGVEAVRRFARAYRRRTEALEDIADAMATLAGSDRDDRVGEE